MIKKITGRFAALIAISLIFSCEGDPDLTVVPPGAFEKGGVFVSCQGLFNTTSGTITHYDPDSKKLTQEIYKGANDGQELGNIVQSLYVIGSKAYIIINNAGKMVIVDARDFVNQKSIETFNLPRYITEVNDSKLYISQWGIDGSSGSLIIFNTILQEITGEITLRNGPEQMLVYENKVYVANSGGFSRDSIVHVIDTNLDIWEKDIIVGDNPVSLVKDQNNQIWILCRGYTDWNEPGNSTSGKLVKMNNDELVSIFEVPNGAENLCINPDGNTLYFTGDGKIFKHEIGDSQFDGNFIVEASFYGLNMDPSSGLLYAADAKDFNSKGQVFIFSEAGEELGAFETGIIPQAIYFE